MVDAKLTVNKYGHEVYEIEGQQYFAHQLCRTCGKPLDIPEVGRKPRFCSNACKQRHYRERKKWIQDSIRCALEHLPEPPRSYEFDVRFRMLH